MNHDPQPDATHTIVAEVGVISVEVAYALPQQQWLLSVTVPVGATVQQAIHVSGIEQQVPDLTIDPESLGIFSQKTTLDTVLSPGDRVEIYRPLIIDPKESRRLRAQQGDSAD